MPRVPTRIPLALLLAALAARCVDMTYEDFVPGLGEDPIPPVEVDGVFPGGADGGVRDGGTRDGGGGGPVDAGAEPPPVCDDAFRRCAHVFTYTGSGSERSVEVRGSFDDWGSGRTLAKDGTRWSGTVAIPWNVDVQYKFVVDGTWLNDPNPQVTQVSNGLGGTNSLLRATTCDPWTCAEAPPPPSNPWPDQVLYFVMVDRFLNGNPANDAPVANVEATANWAGGDWAGLKSKIDAGYFESLGVTALWLSVPMDQTDGRGVGLGGDPHFYAAYHGYWPRDLSIPERRLGTAAELTAVVAAAHAHGLKVLVDYAMNHVHTDSPVWTQHRNDGWFNPLDVQGGQCVCGSNVCDWNDPNKLTRCWFAPYLPDFNFDNADARAFSVQTGVKWARDYDLDGFRLDAIKHVELSWLVAFRAALKADEAIAAKQPYLVGETFEYGDRQKLKDFVDPATKLDGQFDFPLRKWVVEALLMRAQPLTALASFMDSNTSYYGPDAVMSTFVGNHDMGRSIHFAEDVPLWDSVYADGKDRSWTNVPGTVQQRSAYERLALGYAVLFTNRGLPLVYYGDEIGLAGGGDPDNRRPMPWSGYTSDQEWLKARLGKLGAIRKAHPALRRGQRTTLSLDADTWAYRMGQAGDEVFVLLNRADTQRRLGNLPNASFLDEISGEAVTGPSIAVPPRGVRVLKRSGSTP